MSNPKKKIIILSLITVVLLGLNYLSFKKTHNKFATVYSGDFARVEGNSIFLHHGAYRAPDSHSSINAELYDVEVLVTPQTEFMKTVWHWPTKKEIGPTGQFDGSIMKQDHLPGSFEELKNKKLNMVVTGSGNIYYSRKFKAKKIEYYDFIYPKD